MSALEVRGARAGYDGTPVLRGVDLAVPAGEMLAVLGPSGCGKTTLLRAVAGLHRLDAGEVRVAGTVVAGDGTHREPERRGVGLVPQEGALFPHLDVAANVGFGLSRAQRRAGTRVAELLELVGLGGHGPRAVAELSGGQQQRVALARALAPGPAVVLLDEPFSALDAGLRATVRAQVRAVLREAGVTSVLVTHDQDEALSTADLVAVLDGGVLAQLGTPAQVYHRPATPAVATFVGRGALLAGTVTDGWARSALGTHPCGAAVVDGPAQVLLRPEQLRVGGAEGPGAVAVEVLERRFHGAFTEVTVRLADGQRLEGWWDPDAAAVAVAATGAAWARVHGPVRCFPGAGLG